VPGAGVGGGEHARHAARPQLALDDVAVAKRGGHPVPQLGARGRRRMDGEAQAPTAAPDWRDLAIATAEAGQAFRNSTVAVISGGTTSRPTGTKPKRGK
jgi:hypothetical protein